MSRLPKAVHQKRPLIIQEALVVGKYLRESGLTVRALAEKTSLSAATIARCGQAYDVSVSLGFGIQPPTGVRLMELVTLQKAPPHRRAGLLKSISEKPTQGIDSAVELVSKRVAVKSRTETSDGRARGMCGRKPEPALVKAKRALAKAKAQLESVKAGNR